MHLLYIANIRFPTEKAHGAQIAHMCHAFAATGNEVTLVVPRRFNTLKDDPFTYYGLPENIHVVKLPVIDLAMFGRIGFWIETITFTLVTFLYTLRMSADIVYGRDEFVLLPLVFVKKSVVWEAHMPRGGVFQKILIQRLKKLVVISQGLKKFFLQKGVPLQKILVAHDGVALEDFPETVEKKEVRERLGIRPDVPVVMYIGRIDGWKGVGTLLEASTKLSGVHVVIVGEGELLPRYKTAYPDVQFLGVLPYRDLGINQQAADVLIIPNSAVSAVSRLYTSPLKVFAHMASGVPMVVSDLPSLREVLDEENAFFAQPDNADSFAEKITHVLSYPKEAQRRAQQAKEDVVQYTWQARALHILDSLPPTAKS